MAIHPGYIFAIPAFVHRVRSTEAAGPTGGGSGPTMEHVVRVVTSDTRAAVAKKGLEDGDAGRDVA